jgi:uncharacterized protein (TIGR03437 family)
MQTGNPRLSRLTLATITMLAAQSVCRAQIITTFAGGGDSNILGDGGPAIQASLNEPRSAAFDALGNLYIADYMNNRIRRVTPTGTISTVAGNGTLDSNGDGGLATNAAIRLPVGVATDNLGHLYFSENVTYRVRRVDPSGIITTIAGTGTPGPAGDGGPAAKAQLYGPSGLAVDATGNLYIADTNNQRIRKIDLNGIITTVAGNPTAASTGDGGLATATRLSSPTAVAFDNSGNLLIAEGNRIRRVNSAGVISTVAGSNAAGATGDGGPAINATLQTPYGVAVDASGNIYIGDSFNNRVRKVDTNGIITTISGGHTGSLGDGGPAVNSALALPEGLAFDAAANLYIADVNHNVIRKITGLGAPVPVITSVLNGASLFPGVAPNAWATIKGSNLSAVTDTWDKAVVDGRLPTKLDNVSVTVGGQSAYIYYVSPGQINFIVPDVGFGAEQVIVSNSSGSSAPFTATSSQYSPTFFLWPSNQTVATRQDFTWAVKNGTFSGSVTAPAKPGDVIILWGTGFGPTAPLAPTGVQTPSDQTYSTSAPPKVTINNAPATVYGAALAPGNAALFQIAIQVPNTIPDGDWPIQATIGGAQSQSSAILSVHK